MIIPINIDLHTWAASLIQDFPNDNVPILARDDKDWKKWGNFLVTCQSFMTQGAPPPSQNTNPNEDWHPWAMRIYLTMLDVGN